MILCQFDFSLIRHCFLKSKMYYQMQNVLPKISLHSFTIYKDVLQFFFSLKASDNGGTEEKFLKTRSVFNIIKLVVAEGYVCNYYLLSFLYYHISHIFFPCIFLINEADAKFIRSSFFILEKILLHCLEYKSSVPA